MVEFWLCQVSLRAVHELFSGSVMPNVVTRLELTVAMFQVLPSPALLPPVEDVRSARLKRAPRPLTGRHVRPGTGARPRTLLLLRQKVLERMRRKKELLGEEDSPVILGAVKRKRAGDGGGGQQSKKRVISETWIENIPKM